MIGSIGTGDAQDGFDVEGGVVAVGVIAGAALLAAIGSFLLGTPYTIIPLAVFVAAVAYGWVRHQAETAYGLTALATLVGIVVLGLILIFLVWESRTAWDVMGMGLLTRTQEPVWSTSSGTYGLLVALHGTVLVTAVATFISAPLGIAGALFISEIAPPRVGEIVKPGIEILAGIPSIVYGFVGFVIINPYVYDEFQLSGQWTYLATGAVVGLMALPTVVSVSEDAINAIPEAMKSGSLALGSSDWQTMKGITLPAAFSGISAAVILGVGRAIGETMAATVMLPNVFRTFTPKLYDAFAARGTLTSMIAAQYGDATETQMSALFAAGVLLFVIVMVLSLISQYIEARMRRQLEGDA